ncbi:hypothetical protein SARC_04915 [Sphaeroforma arctica JP610]|uniref:Uncharacterized protein n=1 Tax=Sphaeroforma arctica JP610 TaxID=667725 RepID=A0A0L0G150_9EUKA|nr:hypothetical protein SARC_04915 [Sphaeroforma arctica JP610]KNC82810.1 hypothetical protein SARC_04915 [Sphaeroforma arctica JP610]|eukprot:XP_014156712.1 hypothetical protein SARC_04915 [Sphaeroforma arctica JP610]
MAGMCLLWTEDDVRRRGSQLRIHTDGVPYDAEYTDQPALREHCIAALRTILVGKQVSLPTRPSYTFIRTLRLLESSAAHRTVWALVAERLRTISVQADTLEVLSYTQKHSTTPQKHSHNGFLQPAIHSGPSHTHTHTPSGVIQQEPQFRISCGHHHDSVPHTSTHTESLQSEARGEPSHKHAHKDAQPTTLSADIPPPSMAHATTSEFTPSQSPYRPASPQAVLPDNDNGSVPVYADVGNGEQDRTCTRIDPTPPFPRIHIQQPCSVKGVSTGGVLGDGVPADVPQHTVDKQIINRNTATSSGDGSSVDVDDIRYVVDYARQTEGDYSSIGVAGSSTVVLSSGIGTECPSSTLSGSRAGISSSSFGPSTAVVSPNTDVVGSRSGIMGPDAGIGDLDITGIGYVGDSTSATSTRPGGGVTMGITKEQAIAEGALSCDSGMSDYSDLEEDAFEIADTSVATSDVRLKNTTNVTDSSINRSDVGAHAGLDGEMNETGGVKIRRCGVESDNEVDKEEEMFWSNLGEAWDSVIIDHSLLEGMDADFQSSPKREAEKMSTLFGTDPAIHHRPGRRRKFSRATRLLYD